MDNILSIDNVISVTVTSIPAGLGIPNVNNIAMFSVEQPGNADVFRIYKTAKEVGTDYGTSSLTYKMAVNIFSQTPNLLSGAGRLIIFPLLASVSATQGIVVTDDISANLAAILLISDGEFKATVNGVVQEVKDLDFTNETDLAGVASVIQKAIYNMVMSEDSDKITFKSKQAGAVSAIVLAAPTVPAGTDITVAGLLNIPAATTTDGADSSGEKLLDAVTRTEGLANYCGVISTLVMEDAIISDLAASIQAKDMIALLAFADKALLTGIIKTISDASQSKIRCLLYTTDIEDAQLMLAAYVGRMFSVNFGGSNTTNTANLKSLANVVADLGLTQTDYESCKTVGADIYVSYANLARTLSSEGNTYFDRVYNQQQLKFNLQVIGFNYLATTTTKIPQTEEGMDGLKSVFKDVCEAFVSNGYIGVGLSWNSADKFGNPEDFVRNILERGFYIYSQPIADQDQSERDSRTAPLVQIAVKEAGSIHSAIVNVIAEA